MTIIKRKTEKHKKGINAENWYTYFNDISGLICAVTLWSSPFAEEVDISRKSVCVDVFVPS